MKKRRVIIVVILFVLIGLPLLGILTIATRMGQLFMVGQNAVTPGVMMGRVTKGEAGFAVAAPGVVSSDVVMGRPAIMPYPMPTVWPGDKGFVAGDNRVIVKNANLSLVVEDVRGSVDQISQLAKDSGGLVTSSNIYDNSQFQQSGVQANVTIRVPVDKLDDTVVKLRKLASKILSESITADDRTKQQTDIQAQLRNLQATETQFQALLKQAKNVNETLQIQQQLNSIRTQIDQTQAQLQNLNGAAAMSTINVNLISKQSDLPAVGPQQNSIFEEVQLALRDMVRLYRTLFIQGIRNTILLLPLIILGVIAWFLWKMRAKKS